MRISAGTVIDRPVADVFGFVAENHHVNHPRWDRRVVRLEPAQPGPPALGTEFRMTRTLMGRREVHTFRYVEWEPEQTMSYQSQGGPMPLLFQARFAPAGERSTRLTIAGSADLRGPRALLAPVLGHLFTRQLRENLLRIKEFVEAEG